MAIEFYHQLIKWNTQNITPKIDRGVVVLYHYPLYVFCNFSFITPRACAIAQGGKVIGRVVVVVVVSTKIAISRGLGTWATSKHNESVEFGEKLPSACFESRDAIHERHK